MNAASPNFSSYAVIPAAGKSRRMGRPKLLLPWGERTVIETVLAAWRASRTNQIVVVLDKQDASDLGNIVQQCGCDVVRADAPSDMKASVQCALNEIQQRWAPQAHDAWLLAPADFPTLSATWIDQLLAAYDPRDPQPLVPWHDNRRGHPVLFPWSLARAARSLPDDAGIKGLLIDNPPRQIEMSDAGMFADMNTPEEYQRLRKQFDRD